MSWKDPLYGFWADPNQMAFASNKLYYTTIVRRRVKAVFDVPVFDVPFAILLGFVMWYHRLVIKQKFE